MLRFFALWEDADSLQGKTRPVTIQYFLADDTVEIRMVHEPNSGRDPYPVLMRRQTLPKKIKLASGEYQCICVTCVTCVRLSLAWLSLAGTPEDIKTHARHTFTSLTFP